MKKKNAINFARWQMYIYYGHKKTTQKKQTNKQTKSSKTESENTMLTAYTAKKPTVKNSIRWANEMNMQQRIF